jgi:hypothetical protein
MFIGATIFGLVFGLLVQIVIAEPARAEMYSPWVDGQGNVSLPSEFRLTMVHLGSWFVPSGAASGFHDVYADRDSVETYRRTCKFRDGAILVKELRASAASNYTTGENVSYATGEIKQWFVMIKDTRNRFPENPLWGNGWGWALFKTSDPTKNVASDYKKDCLGCHVPAKAKDWVYTEGYPSLREP